MHGNKKEDLDAFSRVCGRVEFSRRANWTCHVSGQMSYQLRCRVPPGWAASPHSTAQPQPDGHRSDPSWRSMPRLGCGRSRAREPLDRAARQHDEAALAARRPCLRRRASAQLSVADGAGARRDPVVGADFLEIRAVIQSGSQTKGISLTDTCPPPIERVRRGAASRPARARGASRGVVRVRGLDVRRGTKTDRWGRGATWTP